MPSDREKLENETLQQLADRMQDGPDSARRYYAPLAELERRKALWAEQAAKAQEEAAEAAIETALYTRKSARNIFWSVLAILIASILGAIIPSLLTYFFPHTH